TLVVVSVRHPPLKALRPQPFSPSTIHHRCRFLPLPTDRPQPFSPSTIHHRCHFLPPPTDRSLPFSPSTIHRSHLISGRRRRLSQSNLCHRSGNSVVNTKFVALTYSIAILSVQ
uniref:Uncharacterized protein n=1 Tax=Cucumis melo TaxID=3656 RepID=A0A9I9E9S7_CUCME